MKVEDLIIELREVIDDAKTLPLSGGKSVIDAEHVKEILDDIEETLPQEVRQAKAIVADRAQIIADAKKEGESIVRSAEERKKTLVNQNEIVRQAQQEANEIISDAKLKAKEIRKAANEYVEELMRKTDELMTAQANEIKKTRQSLKASQRTGN
ncbi:MAG: ATPase [Acutalibacteraceae bacterium]|nr:ATPase [Acutalibacteraceae bacterium]HIR03320.1 ATPase [Candidatus Scatovicinus merdipullorum]